METVDYDLLMEKIEFALERHKRVLRFALLGAAIIQFILLAALAWRVVFTTPLWDFLQTPPQEVVAIDRLYRAMAILFTSGVAIFVLYGLMLAMDAGWFDKSMRGQAMGQAMLESLVASRQTATKQKREDTFAETNADDPYDIGSIEIIPERLKQQEKGDA